MSTEKDLEKILLKEGSRLGSILFKNEVGLAWTKNGYPIKFGLCKGSSDLIGLTPLKVTQEMVGSTIGVFTALEVKKDRRKYKASFEQESFLRMVREHGGLGGIIESVEELKKILKGKKNENSN